MTITYALIQMVGKIAGEITTKARLTELIMSSGACLMHVLSSARKTEFRTRQPWNVVQMST